MGHFCRICGRARPNEQFSGRGHRIHVCKKCQRLPREQRDRIERLDELHGFLHQSVISAKNVARLKTLTCHSDCEVAELAALILEISRVLPGKRSRWLKLAQRDRPLFHRTVAFFGVEFFEDLLAGYGDFESPLWRISNKTGSAPHGLSALGIAAAAVHSGTAVWKGKTTWPTRKLATPDNLRPMFASLLASQVSDNSVDASSSPPLGSNPRRAAGTSPMEGE